MISLGAAGDNVAVTASASAAFTMPRAARLRSSSALSFSSFDTSCTGTCASCAIFSTRLIVPTIKRTLACSYSSPELL